VAEIVTDVLVFTTLVVTVNFALVAPADTVTLAGTVATAVLLLERVTITPPVGAGSDSVTVPVDGLPPVTVLGLRVSELRAGAAVLVICPPAARVYTTRRKMDRERKSATDTPRTPGHASPLDASPREASTKGEAPVVGEHRDRKTTPSRGLEGFTHDEAST
jgi:hypothetical protein